MDRFWRISGRLTALRAAKISATANASHVVPNGVTVRNAKSFATICRAICSFDIAASCGNLVKVLSARDRSASNTNGCDCNRSAVNGGVQAIQREAGPARRAERCHNDGEYVSGRLGRRWRPPPSATASQRSVVPNPDSVRTGSVHALSDTSSSTSRTIARRSFASSILTNAFTKSEPSEVARKSAT